MNLRPYLTSGKRKSNQVPSSCHKRSVPNHVKNLSNVKKKEKQCDSTDKLKPRPFSTNSSHKINLLSKEFLNKQKAPSITATNFLLYDSQNHVYVGQRQDHQREVASLTKIMTTVVALQLIEKYKLDKNLLIRISKGSAALNGTSANLPEGSFIKLFDLIYGTMLPSGNDAAYQLAEVLGLLLFYENIKPQEKEYNDIESIDLSYYDNTITFVNKFIREMNRKAKELKMSKTNFTNPHGLGNVLNVSTAKDMLILSRYAVQNGDFREAMSTKQFSSQLFEENSQVIGRRLWKNTNKLINMGWQGVKTGHTPSAGCCLSSLRDGIFIVVLNSLSTDSRFKDTIEIFQWYHAREIFSSKTSNQVLDQSPYQIQPQ